MSQKEDTMIRFSGLKPGIYTYSFMFDEAYLKEQKNDEIEGGKVEFSVKMERFERMLMFEIALKGEIIVPCDRCLDPLTLPIEGHESLCARFSDDEESDDEDTVILPADAIEIDLAPWLYEYIAVRIPLQHMHSNPDDCNPEVGKYLNTAPDPTDEEYVDPRWDALRQLK